MATQTRWNTDPKVAPLRAQLAACSRLLHREKILNYSGHISVRLPDRDAFLIQSFSESRAQVSPESLVICDLDANVIEGPPGYKPPIEVFIHSEILRARSDIQAVVHTHAPHAVAFSSLGRELAPISNDAGFFYKKLPVFSETTDLIVTPERGKAVAKCLGENSAVLLRNHGIVTVGRSIEEAVWVAVRLERACQSLLMVEAAGGPKLLVDTDDLERKNKRGTRPDNFNNVFAYLVRSWCRKYGRPGDPCCCAEDQAIDASGYEK